MAKEGSMINSEKSRSLMSRILYASKSSDNKQIAKRVEAALYNYPMWKVNSEQLQFFHRGISAESKDTLERPIEGLGIRRIDYISHINLIEATLSVLSPLQQAFVRQRYFKRKPFKIIAEELAVTERHLYRIRQQIIRLFELSFGWL
jgi:DNA-directed RNA polymerase specialized sigma subunit